MISELKDLRDELKEKIQEMKQHFNKEIKILKRNQTEISGNERHDKSNEKFS